MIRKLTAADHASVMPLLKADPSFNAFLIGDIEHFGYDRDFQELWGELDEGRGSRERSGRGGDTGRCGDTDRCGDTGRGGLKAVLLRYHSHFVLYAPGPHDQEGFSQRLRRSDRLRAFSGKEQALSAYGSFFPGAARRLLTYAELDPSLFRRPADRFGLVRRATADDAAGIYRLRSVIPEFSDFTVSVAGIRMRIQSGLGRTFLIRKRGAVIAAASTTAESSVSTVVGGVMTHPSYRRQGLASGCLAALCSELLSEGKLACLFYDDPRAGRIYDRMGFRSIGRWIMYSM